MTLPAGGRVKTDSWASRICAGAPARSWPLTGYYPYGWVVQVKHRRDTFHNEWQNYRTRKDNTLALETMHSYAEAGEYTVVVKVIDILGNDTTKTIKVKVA
jgi:hypothetical protein